MRRARAPLRSSRPTRACRGRPESAAARCRAAARARAPRRDGGRSRDRADSVPPCRGRRRCRTDAWIEESVFGTGDSHLHGRGIDARRACIRRRLDVHRQRIVAGAEPGEIDEGCHVSTAHAGRRFRGCRAASPRPTAGTACAASRRPGCAGAPAGRAAFARAARQRSAPVPSPPRGFLQAQRRIRAARRSRSV